MKLRQPNQLQSRLSQFVRYRLYTVMALLLVLAVPFYYMNLVIAAQLTDRSLQMSDSTAGATNVLYNFNFTTATAGDVGSLTFEFCSNYLFDAIDVCDPPAGFNAAGVSIASQSGLNGFVIDSSSNTNKVVVVRNSPQTIPVTPVGMQFAGMTNQSADSSFYVKIATYISTDASGAHTDTAMLVAATNQSITVTTEVPPYLYFCTGISIDGFNCGTATGNVIDFGELSTAQARVGTSQMLASTNAPYGYSVTLFGSTLTAGTNVIPAMNTQASLPGTSQFGLNTRENSNPNVGTEPIGSGFTTAKGGYNSPNLYRFRSGEIVVSNNTSDDFRKFTVSYIANKNQNQAVGRYVATLSYICLANF